MKTMNWNNKLKLNPSITSKVLVEKKKKSLAETMEPSSKKGKGWRNVLKKKQKAAQPLCLKKAESRKQKEAEAEMCLLLWAWASYLHMLLKINLLTLKIAHLHPKFTLITVMQVICRSLQTVVNPCSVFNYLIKSCASPILGVQVRPWLGNKIV